MKFAAFGRTQWLYESIKAAIANGHQAVLIGTCPAAPEYTVREKDFESLADELGCPFFCAPKINRPEYIRLVQASEAEIAISVNWLTLIGQKMIDQFKHGIVNAHAGDLPRFRGNACPNWAILTGEDKVVLTLHQMVTDLDTGSILLKRSFPLTAQTYIADVYRFMEDNIPSMYAEVLGGLTCGKIIPEPQPEDPQFSLRCFARLPQDGQVDWHRPADELARLVRGSAEPFAGAYSFLNGEKLIIWRAKPDHLPYPYLGVPGQVAERRKKKEEVVVLAGQGVLVLEEVETKSGGRKPAAELIKSTRTRLGLDLQIEIDRLRAEIDRLQNNV